MQEAECGGKRLKTMYVLVLLEIRHYIEKVGGIN